MKLELGAGHRPTHGYEHNDLHAFDGIDFPGRPCDLNLPTGSLEEVFALGFVEHLTYFEALDTFRNVHRMLQPGGLFLFDVPDFPVWARYYVDAMDGIETPVPLEHIRKTLFGWQRWPGDEHKWGWDFWSLRHTVIECGFVNVSRDIDQFRARAHRNRFDNPADAHLYVIAEK